MPRADRHADFCMVHRRRCPLRLRVSRTFNVLFAGSDEPPIKVPNTTLLAVPYSDWEALAVACPPLLSSSDSSLPITADCQGRGSQALPFCPVSCSVKTSLNTVQE